MRSDVPVPLFTVREASRLTRIPARTLRRWLKEDRLVHANETPEDGTRPARYLIPASELAELTRVLRLRRRGQEREANSA